MSAMVFIVSVSKHTRINKARGLDKSFNISFSRFLGCSIGIDSIHIYRYNCIPYYTYIPDKIDIAR